MASNKSQKLEDQAATAALYVTKGKGDHSKDSQGKPSNYPLDEDNKLSSASAATSLKYASPRDLPAYPVVGLTNTESSAGAAASLANKNKKAFEHWKPGDIPDANKAAMLAKDYKAAPLWHPELSAAGSKAALLAQKEGGDVKIWRPEATDAGNSAAGQAMRMKGLSPQLDYGYTADGGKRALTAATGAMAGSRRRAGSTPIQPSPYPDSENSAANALKAATSANKPSPRAQPVSAGPIQPPVNAARIHNAAVTNLSREMYTSHPPVAPELEEKNKQAGLRAAAISMAKQMYDVQQRAIDEAAETGQSDSRYAATSVHNRPQSAMSDESQSIPQYTNLQEAAQKLAAERLAKLHDEHAAYRTYYGTQAVQPSRKLSIRTRPRRRASSDGHLKESDEERSRQIRSEMSLFTDKVAQVDNRKRQKDRDSLLAAAQRNVRASMHGMDEKVFNETGKVSPAMMTEWEAKARAKAEAESSTRMVNHGRVNIGGGRYMDQSEVDAIAATRVQPTLDDITVTAEKQRARDEELRQQQLERERIAAEKEQDQKERDARTKEDWRRFKEQEKQEARARKEEERASKIEQRRLREEEKRKTREEKAASKAPVKEETVVEPVAETEPPILDPIPTVELISTVPTDVQPLSGAKEGNGPPVVSTTGSDSISAEGPELEPVTTEESDLAPVVTAESGTDLARPLSGDAEEIAQRVFAAPVQDSSTLNTSIEPSSSEIQDLANATTDTTVAPVVMPASTQESSSAPAPAPKEASATTKHDTPVAAKTAQTVPAATVETTVSGPSTSPKPKDSGKVASWLKTKFSRRTSKPAKPEIPPSVTDSKEKGFVGGASLTNAEASKASSDGGGSSMHEVAMAGKDNATSPAGTAKNPVVGPVADDDLANHPVSAGALQQEPTTSTEISSLSSDEDTRGRSAVPRDQERLTRDEFVREEIANGAQLDPALTKHSKAESSSAGGKEEFEEARDTFDTERLNPPPPGSLGGGGRASDSPARDSKFLEDL